MLEEDQLERVAHEIRNKMTFDKPFLQTHFDLKMLSSLLGHSERLISEVINNAFKQNFNQFTNSYRLEAAIAMMKDDKKGSKLLKEIMYESGFSNKASFNNAFRSKFNTSPSTYRKYLAQDTEPSRSPDQTLSSRKFSSA